MKKKANMTGGVERPKNPIKSSLIISLLSKASSAIYRGLGDGAVGTAFTAYSREDGALKEGAFSQVRERADLSGRFLTPAKRKIARKIEDSVIIGALRDLLHALLASSMKSYGIFVFSFSLYSAIAYLFRIFYFNGGVGFDVSVGVTLGFMLIASVLMIASRHNLSSALLTSPIARAVLFKLIGVQREEIEAPPKNEGRFHIPFIAGLLFGIVSAFIHPLYLLLGVAGIVAAYTVLMKPEVGVVAILVLLPFAPTMALVGAVLYTAVCYLIKVMCGKRSLKFDLLDITVLFFMLMTVSGGLVSASGESLKPTLVYTAFMVGYFLVVNLIRSREWFMRAIVGTAISASAVGLYGLYQNFFGSADTTWHDAEMFSDIKGRVVSTFENPNVLAEYLIMVIPLMLALFIAGKGSRTKVGAGLALILTGGCLIYTWSRGAWLGIIIGLLIFFLMYSKNTLSVLLFGVLGIPFLPFVLPDSIIERFLSIGNLADSSTSYRVSIWRGVLDMLGDFWQSGIGIGIGPFSSVYPLYSLAGSETALHSHNLYLQMTVELGIVGLAVFLILMFVNIQGVFEFHKTEVRCEKLYSAALACGILSVLAQGMTDYIWYNYRVFLMFWLLIGLGAAVRKTMKSTAPAEIF